MDQQPRLPLWFFLVNLGLLAAAFFMGVTLARPDLPAEQLRALEHVHRRIVDEFVEPIDAAKLLDVATAQMVRSLDDYSEYVPHRLVAAYDERSTGRYEGIGMLQLVGARDGEIVVAYPFAGGPAEKAGLLPGDRIVAIDGKRVAELPPEERAEATWLSRGPADTEVRLLVARDDGDVEIAVKRGGVQRGSVKWAHYADPEQGLGYVHLAHFHPGSAEDLIEAVDGLRAHATLRGLVIDLRFDGGGDLDECVRIARSFLASGTIVTTRRRDQQVVQEIAADPSMCRYPDLPLVLLVNGDSASASEVLAGAFQDHHRAGVVGVRTYGKGVVNTVWSWKTFRLKLTTARYYTPSGRNLGRVHNSAPEPPANGGESRDEGGIVPDVEARVTAAQQKAVRTTLDANEPPAKHLAAFEVVAARYGQPVPRPPQAEQDTQLAASLAALRERVRDAAAGKAAAQPK